MFFRAIACEIAVRELCFLAARSPNLIDLEFLTQGYHDTPAKGRAEIQNRIDAVPAGKYDAILLGYGLCSNILTGLVAKHTKVVIPRAHDCITLFLGSKKRYAERFDRQPGTYYFSSGWLECATRRGEKAGGLGAGALSPALNLDQKSIYDQLALKYGEEDAKYLMEEMSRWTSSYTHGTLIGFDFLKHLNLDKSVRQICSRKGWQFEEIEGDATLLQKLLDGDWPEADFLTVEPGQKVVVTHDENIIGVSPA